VNAVSLIDVSTIRFSPNSSNMPRDTPTNIRHITDIFTHQKYIFITVHFFSHGIANGLCVTYNWHNGSSLVLAQ
jgi:hypothetical protein